MEFEVKKEYFRGSTGNPPILMYGQYWSLPLFGTHLRFEAPAELWDRGVQVDLLQGAPDVLGNAWAEGGSMLVYNGGGVIN